MIGEGLQGWWTVAASGAVGAFIDFYIGKAGQRQVRDWLETWWLKFSYVRWGNLGREEALFAIPVMDRLFGSRLFFAKRLIVVVFTTLACASLTVAQILFNHFVLSEWQAFFTADNLVWLVVIFFSRRLFLNHATYSHLGFKIFHQALF